MQEKRHLAILRLRVSAHMSDGAPMQLSENALIDLQTKVAHHEFAIENLQQAVLDQSSTLHKLEKLVKDLQERLEGATGEGQDIGPANEKPPHY